MFYDEFIMRPLYTP